MSNRMMLLVNPNAGKGEYKTVLAEILHTISDSGWLPTVVFTKYAGEAKSRHLFILGAAD